MRLTILAGDGSELIHAGRGYVGLRSPTTARRPFPRLLQVQPITAAVELWPRRLSRRVFASGHTRTPEGVIQLVQERVEALCLDSRHGSHGCTGRCVPACVVQHRCEIFGDCAIEA